MKNFLVLLFVVTTILLGCESGGKEDPTPTPKSKKELASSSWTVTKVTVNGSDLNTSNYSLNFAGNGNFTISAPDVDDPDFPGNGTWAFNSNETQIILNGSVGLDVIMLTEDDFILEYSYQNFKAGNVTFRFEMVLVA